MNLRCKDNISIFLKHSSKRDRLKIKLLLAFMEKGQIKNLKHLAEVIKSSLAATSRLVNRIGYDHFKDFKNDLNHQGKKEQEKWIDNNQLINEGIAIICSKRSKAAGDFLKSRLDTRYDVILFKGITTEVNNFVLKNQARLFILLTITGDSHRVSVAITKIANLNKMPKVILSSYALYLSIFKKYDYLRIIKPLKHKIINIRNKWDEDIAMSYLCANVLEFLQFNLE